MDIPFSYEVVKVDYENKFMEVVYTAHGFEPVLVGTALPTTEDSLDDVVRAYAPRLIWEKTVATYQDIRVGTVGELSTLDPALAVVPDADEPEGLELQVALLETQADLHKEAIREIVLEVLNEQVV